MSSRASVFCVAAMVGLLTAGVIILSVLAPQVAIADRGPAFWMSADELSRSFSGSEITGTYADGRTFNERYEADGSLVYVEHEPLRQLAGYWSIVSGRFCTIYDDSPTGGCFRVRRSGSNCFEFYFDTRTEAEARSSTPARPTWTARAWRIDAPATCNGEPSV